MIDALRRDAWPRGVRRVRRELEAAREALRRELGARADAGRPREARSARTNRASRSTIVRISTIESTSPLAECGRVDSSTLPAVLVPERAAVAGRCLRTSRVRARVRGAMAQLPPARALHRALYYFAEATMKQIGEAIGGERVARLAAPCAGDAAAAPDHGRGAGGRAGAPQGRQARRAGARRGAEPALDDHADAGATSRRSSVPAPRPAVLSPS